MNLEEFLRLRTERGTGPRYRDICPACRKALQTCYCHRLKPFVSPVSFVILQHPEEARNPIATARMAHLSIKNSRLIGGKEFSGRADVDQLINDPASMNFMLYPSRDAMSLEDSLRLAASTPGMDPVFWILDSKWAQAPKMVRYSPNLQRIPMVGFNPDRESIFKIRRQPDPKCLSTIESIYLVIDQFIKFHGIETTDHEALLEVFQYLVDQQLEYARVRAASRHRRPMRGNGGRIRGEI